MRQRESWQHEWGEGVMRADENGALRIIKRCTRSRCPWEMKSQKNSNRYRSGPNGKWVHAPKDCEGSDGPALEPHPAASIMAWPKKEKP